MSSGQGQSLTPSSQNINNHMVDGGVIGFQNQLNSHQKYAQGNSSSQPSHHFGPTMSTAMGS
jgi:hypothetical protein